MLNNHAISSDKNTRANFTTLFSHISRYYLGSMTTDEINRITVSELPYGALVYDRSSHAMKVLTEHCGTKTWKNLTFS